MTRKYGNRTLELETFFERDRAHVELRDADTFETIVEWWDEDLKEAITDGYLNPRDWMSSAIKYAEEHELLTKVVGTEPPPHKEDF